MNCECLNNIVTAVADINSAYAANGVDITLNLAGTTLTNYSGTSSSQALSDIRGTSDGQMNEIHALRDQRAQILLPSFTMVGAAELVDLAST